MKTDALEALLRAQVALDLMLDGNDLRALGKACDQYRSAIFTARVSGAWRDQPQLARTAVDLLGRVELAQQRVKNLTRHSSPSAPTAPPILPRDTPWQSDIAA